MSGLEKQFAYDSSNHQRENDASYFENFSEFEQNMQQQ
jgi:hypothetical protein